MASFNPFPTFLHNHRELWFQVCIHIGELCCNLSQSATSMGMQPLPAKIPKWVQPLQSFSFSLSTPFSPPAFHIIAIASGCLPWALS